MTDLHPEVFTNELSVDSEGSWFWQSVIDLNLLHIDFGSPGYCLYFMISSPALFYSCQDLFHLDILATNCADI